MLDLGQIWDFHTDIRFLALETPARAALEKQLDLPTCRRLGGVFSATGRLATASIEDQWRQMEKEIAAIRGLGGWQGRMWLLCLLMRPDALPVDDRGLRKGISVNYCGGERGSRAEAREVSEAWSPYRSVATWCLWRSLDPLPVEY